MEPDVSSLPDFDSLWDYEHPSETETKFAAGLLRELGNSTL